MLRLRSIYSAVRERESNKDEKTFYGIDTDFIKSALILITNTFAKC